MFADIVIPNDNEKEFSITASKLGIKKLYFLYDFNTYNEDKLQKKLDNMGNSNVSVEAGFITDSKNLNRAAQSSKLIAVKSSEKDMAFIESKKIKLIYGFEEINRKDYLHQRASGLNQVLCRSANKNNVAIGFAYSSLLGSDKKSVSILMGRMMQNIALCQKYKVKTMVGSFSHNPFHLRNFNDIESLFALFGMDKKSIWDSGAHIL